MIRTLADDEVDVVGTVLGLARLHQGDGAYLVAWDGQEPMGHVHLARSDPPELQDLEVREATGDAASRRRSSPPRSRLCRSAAPRACASTVSVDNHGARALYESLGYARRRGSRRAAWSGHVQLRTGPDRGRRHARSRWRSRLDCVRARSAGRPPVGARRRDEVDVDAVRRGEREEADELGGAPQPDEPPWRCGADSTSWVTWLRAARSTTAVTTSSAVSSVDRGPHVGGDAARARRAARRVGSSARPRRRARPRGSS